MGYILKFRSPNLYNIIIVTKIKKRFLKKEKVKGFFIFTTMLSLKQVKSNHGIKNGPTNKAVVGLNFLIVWILDTINMLLLFFQFELKMAVHAALMKKKSVKWTTFDAFLRKISFLMFFQEELASFPFKYGKAIFWWSWRLKS